MIFAKTITIFFFSVILLSLFYKSFFTIHSASSEDYSRVAFLHSYPIQDTVYTLTDRYIEVSLKLQRAFLIKKNGERDTFKISSGNPYIPEGIKTPAGIFTVQNKSPLAISKQFNDAKLFNWVGISGNVGFHGLEGATYYRTLGVRPVSHGCMRIGREDGEKLMKSVKVGVPAVIYDSMPARIIAFADSSDIDFFNDYRLIKRGEEQTAYMKKRLDALYSGDFFIVNNRKVFIDGATTLRGARIESGDYAKISPKQKLNFVNRKPDMLKFCDKTHKPLNVFIPDSIANAYLNPKSSDTNDTAIPIDALK